MMQTSVRLGRGLRSVRHPDTVAEVIPAARSRRRYPHTDWRLWGREVTVRPTDRGVSPGSRLGRPNGHIRWVSSLSPHRIGGRGAGLTSNRNRLCDPSDSAQDHLDTATALSRVSRRASTRAAAEIPVDQGRRVSASGSGVGLQVSVTRVWRFECPACLAGGVFGRYACDGREGSRLPSAVVAGSDGVPKTSWISICGVPIHCRYIRAGGVPSGQTRCYNTSRPATAMR